MDVLVVTADDTVTAEDVATVLIEGGYYVRAVAVRSTDGSRGDRWHDGN